MTKKTPARTRKKLGRATTRRKPPVKSARVSKTRARAMRRIAELLREIVALEKRAGGGSSVFSLERLPQARARRAGSAKRRGRSG
jgi:hypothetical protein